MQIRPARVEDVDQVLPLVQKIVALHEQWDATRFGAREDAADMYDHWLRGRADDDDAVFLVAEREGAIVGFLIATVDNNIPIYTLDRYGFVHDLWVEEAYRNEGVGRSMTMLALEQFKKLGVTQVRLDTAMKNEAARKMFEQCGFRASTVEMLCEL
jgi:ribosomal protein S18 acetylase RimI-like enzyme